MKYLLGYDASCESCARTTDRMKHEVGSLLEFAPMQSPLLTTYHEGRWGPMLLGRQP